MQTMINYLQINGLPFCVAGHSVRVRLQTAPLEWVTVTASNIEELKQLVK